MTVLFSYEPTASHVIRVRFVGSRVAVHYTFSHEIWMQLHADWKSYMEGGSVQGGEYALHSDKPSKSSAVSLNFTLVSCLEWDF